MQAPRNWRNNTDRYQLTVNTDDNGNSSVVNRPQSLAQKTTETDTQETTEAKAA